MTRLYSQIHLCSERTTSKTMDEYLTQSLIQPLPFQTSSKRAFELLNETEDFDTSRYANAQGDPSDSFPPDGINRGLLSFSSHVVTSSSKLGPQGLLSSANPYRTASNEDIIPPLSLAPLTLGGYGSHSSWPQGTQAATDTPHATAQMDSLNAEYTTASHAKGEHMERTTLQIPSPGLSTGITRASSLTSIPDSRSSEARLSAASRGTLHKAAVLATAERQRKVPRSYDHQARSKPLALVTERTPSVEYIPDAAVDAVDKHTQNQAAGRIDLPHLFPNAPPPMSPTPSVEYVEEPVVADLNAGPGEYDPTLASEPYLLGRQIQPHQPLHSTIQRAVPSSRRLARGTPDPAHLSLSFEEESEDLSFATKYLFSFGVQRRREAEDPSLSKKKEKKPLEPSQPDRSTLQRKRRRKRDQDSGTDPPKGEYAEGLPTSTEGVAMEGPLSVPQAQPTFLNDFNSYEPADFGDLSSFGDDMDRGAWHGNAQHQLPSPVRESGSGDKISSRGRATVEGTRAARWPSPSSSKPTSSPASSAVKATYGGKRRAFATPLSTPPQARYARTEIAEPDVSLREPDGKKAEAHVERTSNRGARGRRRADSTKPRPPSPPPKLNALLADLPKRRTKTVSRRTARSSSSPLTPLESESEGERGHQRRSSAARATAFETDSDTDYDEVEVQKINRSAEF